MVGQSTQQERIVNGPRGLGREGVALPAAVTALTVLSVLIVGLWTIVDLAAKTSTNRRSAVHGLLVAEAGAAHVLALMRAELVDQPLSDLLLGHAAAGGNR